MSALSRDVELRGHIAPSEIEPLCAMACDPSVLRWRVRGEACAALRFAAGDPAAEEAACAALAQTVVGAATRRTDLGKEWTRRDLPIALVILGAVVTTACVSYPDLRDPFVLLAGTHCLSWPVILIAFAAFEARMAGRMDWVRMQALRSLLALGKPEAVSAVLRACCGGSGDLKTAARKGVEPLLRAVPEDGYGKFGPAVADMLTLVEESTGDLQDACLQALARVGDGRAVEPLERMVDRRRAGGASGADPVVAAIEGMLPVLRERRRMGMAVSRLVRPADRPDDADATLLRPAQPSAPHGAGLLVRPVEESAALPPKQPEDGVGTRERSVHERNDT
jgi:HEAT repeat protein